MKKNKWIRQTTARRQIKMLNHLTPFLSSKEIQNIIKKLALQVRKDYEDSPITLISPLKGSVFFLADFIRELKRPVQVDFVFMEDLGNNNFKIKKDVSIDIKNKRVLTVVNVVDSGRGLSFLMNRLKLSEPAELKSLTLLDKRSHRNTLLQIDYTGRVIEDRFMAGYGMDMDEEGRNYPDIYHLGQ